MLDFKFMDIYCYRYLSLTTQYKYKDWILHKKIIAFSFMPPPHKGMALSHQIYKILSEWRLEKKLSSITLDNASSNDAFVQMLKTQLKLNDVLLFDGDFFHIRCYAHIKG